MQQLPLPSIYDLFNPLLEALHQLGGSATVVELDQKVAELLEHTEAEIGQSHDGNRSKLSPRLVKARTQLKRHGLVDNPVRGTWTLTAEGEKTRQHVKWESRRSLFGG